MLFVVCAARVPDAETYNVGTARSTLIMMSISEVGVFKRRDRRRHRRHEPAGRARSRAEAAGPVRPRAAVLRAGRNATAGHPRPAHGELGAFVKAHAAAAFSIGGADRRVLRRGPARVVYGGGPGGRAARPAGPLREHPRE